MTLVGLTGGIGCGKSTVADQLVHAHPDVAVIDGDALLKQLLQDDIDPQLIEDILQCTVTTDGKFDRKKFLPALFADRDRKEKLEAALGKHIWQRLQQAASRLSADFIVVELATLFESKLEQRFAVVIVADCPLAVRIERLHHTRDLTRAEATTRIQSQTPNAEKVALADLVIDTGCPLAELPDRVDHLHYQLTQFVRQNSAV